MTRDEIVEVMAAAIRKDEPIFTADEAVAAACVALTALEVKGLVVQGWQPIETAPKDGTFVDLLFRGNVRMTDMFWRDDRWWIGDPLDPDYWAGAARPEAMPTHWRPLPPPPAPTERGKDDE